MAAASAGGPKSGIDPASGTINCIPPQQSLSQHQQALMQQHKHHQQQHHQHQFIQQIQQQQQHQNHQQHLQQHQPPQQLHHIIQKQHQTQTYFQPKITVVPKLNDKLIRSNSSGGGVHQSSSESVSNISASHQSQQLNYDNLTIKKPPQILTTKGPNVSKGWRRLIIKGDIVYLSPSGSALTSVANVKEYLLKSGTCKCGLPCPLRPEIFFDFDTEVPNRMLRLNNVENSTCSHIEKTITVQPIQTTATTIVGRRKIVKEWPNSQQKVSTVISSGIIPQSVNNSNVNNNNSNIISIQKQIKSQHNSSSSNILNVGSNVTNSNIHNNISNNQSNLSSSVVVDSKLSNLKLTRSPPWRKKTSFVTPQNQSSQQQQIVNEIIVSNNERVPPLPTQHLPPSHINNQASQQQAPAVGGSQPNIRIIKTGNSIGGGSAAATIRGKKNPSFKDDPTGYLDHQTAILQNSILSVPSPDIPVINESRNVIQPNNSGITINNSPIQIFNNNQHQVININSNGTNFISQNQHHPQHHHHHATAAFPVHNNQILVQQQNSSNDQILHQTSTNQIVTNIPQTTTFCGQTVTHMPNGVVQIHNQSLQAGNHSNQSNSVPSDITMQQQLQIQQQIHQQNQLIRQTQQLQQSHNYPINDEIHVNPSHNDKLLPDSQESPVSSSTTIYSQTPDTTRITPDTIMSSKGPVQGGTISTSNDSTSSSTSSSPVEQPHEVILNTSNAYRLNSYASSETTSKNTITSVLAGRTMTATTSVNPSANFHPARQQYNQSETYDHQNIMSVSNQMPDIQIQQISRDDNSNHSTSSHHSHHGQQQQQFIMTSTGQIILMSNKSQPTQQAGNSGGNTHQMIINTTNGGSGSQQFSIDNHNLHSNVQIISQQNMIQTHKNNQFNNFNNVILSSSGGNNGNGNQNLSGNMLNPQQQQTVVLNTIPSGFVIPNFVDGGQVIINQGGNNTGNYVQQQIQISPDSKRRPKKRKSSMSPQSPSPTTIQVPQQNQSMLQIATPQYSQNFQLSPSLSGITIIPNQTHHKNSQQIIMSHQNGQIIQPINLIGQQLLVPAGLVVAPETTLLQIQNCGPILTQGGMMIRAPSPQNIQNKSFLSPNGQGQQYIVNSNGQVSPIGQIYSTPVGLVVPQTNAGQTFVQQNTTIVQQQTTMMNNNNSNNNNGTKNLIETQSSDNSNVGHSVSTQTAHQQQQIVASLPPDTTTHSPLSPERPASNKSIGNNDQMNMAMVQCVSSSEPDSAVSPFENRQSPAIEYNDRSNTGFRNYQQHTTFKSTDSKIRRIESNMIVDRKNSLDNIESSSSSPPSSQTTTTTTTTNPSNTPPSPNQITFCIGELVWGSVKGHPAWPAKLINPPNGIKITTPGSTWVRWFGRKPNIELVPIRDLKSLSEGLEAHHRAQKDIRKSRKLNAQLENAIQEAMIELDRISSSSSSSSSTTTSSSTTIPTKQKYHNRITKNRRLGGCGSASSSTASSSGIGSSSNITGTVINHGRINKPIKIAPAPAPLQSCQPPSSAHQIAATLNQTGLTINNLTNQIQSNPTITQHQHHHQPHTIQIKCLRSSK